MDDFATDLESTTSLKRHSSSRVASLARPTPLLLKVSSNQTDWLLPLAACCLGWLIYLSLAPWQYDGNQPWPPFLSLFAVQVPSAAFLTNLLLLLPVACFGQGALDRRFPQIPPWLNALLLWASLTLASLALAYAQLLFPPKVAPPVNLPAQQAGIVLGILLWWLAGSRLAAVLGTTDRRSYQRPLWHYVALVGVLPFLLFPIDPAEPLNNLASLWPPASLGVYLQNLQRHLADLFKVSMLWVPVGLVYTLGGYRQTLQVWMLAVALAFGLLGLPLLSSLKTGDVLEIFCALVGTGVGGAIGAWTRWSVGFSAKMAARVAAPHRPAVDFRALAPTLLCRTLALGLLLGVGLSLLDFPRLAPWLSAGLAAYALLLWRFPYAWLLLVPAVLPVLDFAPWTGRFFFDEFDRVVLVTLALALWHGRYPQPGPVLGQPLPLILTLFIGSYLIGLLFGLLPWDALDTNAFSNDWSHYNSLRIGKGILWSLLVLALLRWGRLPEPDAAQRLFAIGIGIGLLGVILPDLWERWQFGNLLDFSRQSRPVADASSLGGDAGKVYPISAIPLLWLWLNDNHNPLLLLTGTVLWLAALYVTLTMISPVGLLALLAALGVLALGSWRRFRLTRRLGLAEIGALLLLGAGIGGSFLLQGGDLQATQDWRTYLRHWSHTVAMMDRNWTTRLFGMGLGRLPETYLYRNLEGVTPTTYRFEQDEMGSPFLRLGSGETLYLAQRVTITPPQRYTLYLDLRGGRKATRLDVSLCEVQRLDASHCRWVGIEVPAGDTDWHPHELAFDSNAMGTGNEPIRRPVELLLYNPVKGTVVEVANLRLVDEQGQELLANGDFSRGGDYWFGKSYNALPWQSKNLWVQILFEQGWLGVLAFMLLLGVLLSRLAAALWRGDAFATALLAAATAFLTLGLFNSAFDAPRLTVLFFSLLFMGVLASLSLTKRDKAARRAEPIRLNQTSPSG